VQFHETIEELKDTFHSIDIRIFSVIYNDEWHNIFTIIRFRRETEDELQKMQDDLIKKCGGLIETEKFKVGIFHYPVENWSKIRNDLSKKYIGLTDSFSVNNNLEIGFNNIITEPQPEHGDYVYKDWKFFTSHNESSKSPRPNYHDELRDNILENQFSNVDDYLSAVFQYDKYDFQRSSWVKIFVPVFFNVEKIEFEHDNVTVNYSAYEQKNIQISFNFFKSVRRRVNTEFTEKKVQDLKLKENSELIQDSVTIKLDTKNVGNSFEMLVIKNKNILIEKEDGPMEDYWKGRTEYTNPLYFVFEQFVKFDELEKMLLEFKSKKIHNDSDVFERGVSWLLTLLGIPNIMLEEYEKTGDASDKISTDIIASFEGQEIFLVNATIGLPKQSDFDREKDYRENIKKIITNKKLEIQSLYFTGKDATESHQSATTNDVTLIDKTFIKLILEYLKKGNLEEAREIIFRKNFA